MIRAEHLQALGARPERAAAYAAPLNIAAERFEINTARRVAAWLAQLAHESAGFSTVVENLNYSSDALARTWPARFAAADGAPNALARRLSRNAREIANLTYANRMGNGSAGTGDGFRYRGRGLIQITGRDNYARCGEALGVDLIARPQLLEQPLYAALSAGWYWHAHDLNKIADTGDIRAITRRINGGEHGLSNRYRLHVAAAAQFGGA